MMILTLTLLMLAAPARAADPSPASYAEDAKSIERLVNANYGYLDRFPGGRMPMTATLRKEAEQVRDSRQLIRYSERALRLLADHHAITGSSLKDSWAVFPSYGDVWINQRGKTFVVEQVRKGSPAEDAGVRGGDMILRVDGKDMAIAVAEFWADLGTTGGGERDAYAARVLAAGRRDRERRLIVKSVGRQPRSLSIPNLYSRPSAKRPPLTAITSGNEYRIRFNDSLGESETIAAFDAAMAAVPRGHKLVIDLEDTASGGNTSIARAVLSWFVSEPSAYQMHNLPAEKRRTGIARQWVEQVLPREGKHYARGVTVRVGRWTGSMGEGLAIGFAAIGTRVEGSRMAGLLGAVYDYKLERSGQVIKFPTERLYTVNGAPRERFLPMQPRK